MTIDQLAAVHYSMAHAGAEMRFNHCRKSRPILVRKKLAKAAEICFPVRRQLM